MELNARAKSILDLARTYSNEKGIRTLGSEFLILAMYETEDSLCHFLLNEYEVTREEIFNITNEVFILRKYDGEYNKSLEEILQKASELAKDNLVSEEHIFMAILMNKNTIAASILEGMGLVLSDLIEDVKEIYDFSKDDQSELSFIKNITKLAKNKELAKVVNREEYLNKLDIIMNRRFKNNPLLIGNAGVGKTAIVEGYAQKLCDDGSDLTILSLNITAMLAGTRYRGDFEERFDKFVRDIASKKNVVIFIDEIHTIMGAATTEGNLDVANMLKPFLARNDIKLIGATTIDEYHKTIENDKALKRRFQPIFINEPSIEETRKILFGIKYEYEKYHSVTISDDILDYLISQSDKKIKRKYRPDKCIDILDDVMSYCRINKSTNVGKLDIDKIIEGKNKLTITDDLDLKYEELNKYKWLNKIDLLDDKPILKLSYKGNSLGLSYLIDDLLSIFNIGYESVLELDLSSYKEPAMITSLIGAPPGYVGYNDEGALSKHILQFPMSLIVFKGFSKACSAIRAFVYNMLLKGSFVDQRGRNIALDSTLVIVEGLEEKRSLGFSNNTCDDNIFDDNIEYWENDSILNNKYKESLRRMNYEVSFDFDISNENKKYINEYLYNYFKNKQSGEYSISKDEITYFTKK